MIVDQDLLEKLILPKVERPAQYVGGEYNMILKDWDAAPVKMCFAFPDTYEIGMSHLGLRLLYDTTNNHSPHLCERAFMPLDDMAALLKANHIPLFSWESHHSLADFDIVGFTLQYELSYSNILSMLDLAGIPVLAADRSENDPLIIAGGPCVYNPEPLADFIDFFVIGEGEEMNLEVYDLVAKMKASSSGKDEILLAVKDIPGVYVPSLYTDSYKADGRFDKLSAHDNAPETVKKRILTDMDSAPFPDKPLLPSVKPVHDRIMLELMRGCTHGCRFCQAGIIYRPVREKTTAQLVKQAAAQVDNSGYDDISLLSLSSADYTDIIPLMENLLSAHSGCGVGISLPSLRVDAMSVGLAARTQEVRKSGITLAPEAGSQHLRDIINKGVTEEDILKAAAAAFSQGYTSIKLYFMIGLPYEENADITAIGELCRKILQLAKQHKPAEIKKPIKITLGVSSFVPKPHTPFQWFGQDSIEKLRAKQQLLRETIRPMRQVTVHFHDPEVSFLEAAFARGDRRLGKALLLAWQKGCHMDGWSECFHFDRWQEAFAECGLSMSDYACRQYAYGEPLPWQHIDCGIRMDWLWNECIKAGRAQLTPDCHYGQCSGCGVCDKQWHCAYAPKTEIKMAPRRQIRELPQQLYKYRLRLAVRGRMIWLSHLDLLGTVERAFRRSGLPVAFSQGFNPHMQISWGPAHPVGLASDSEYLDIIFTEQLPADWCELLNQQLPEGVKLLSARQIDMNAKALMAIINYMDYRLQFTDPDGAILEQNFHLLCGASSWLIERISPKGKKTVDIRPSLVKLSLDGDQVHYSVQLDKGSVPKPWEISKILLPDTPCQAWRIGMYVADGEKLLEP